MTVKPIKRIFPTIIWLVFACLLTGSAFGSTEEEVIEEKRIQVVMRMIGHEALICLGDKESRVLPIEKIGDRYKISFESEFGFDPSDFVQIIKQVMTETRIGTDYWVEIEQCSTQEVVHTFEIRNAYPDVIPCSGRILPKDCYSLFITILDGTTSTQLQTADSIGTMASPRSNPGISFKSTFFLIPVLILIGVIGFTIKKRPTEDLNPNLVSFGGTKFDTKNMVLSFQDRQVSLSNKEAELLSVLHAFVNEPVERELILQKVWGDEGDYIGRTLDVFISKLRKKLEADPSVKIVNIRGVGYKLLVDI